MAEDSESARWTGLPDANGQANRERTANDAALGFMWFPELGLITYIYRLPYAANGHTIRE